MIDIRWIPVNERWPDAPEKKETGKSKLVLVTDGKSITQAFYDFDKKAWFSFEYKFTITHWMPDAPLLALLNLPA